MNVDFIGIAQFIRVGVLITIIYSIPIGVLERWICIKHDYFNPVS